MPLIVKKYKTGYRVYVRGTEPLSKKTLTKEQAIKQKTAVQIRESKRARSAPTFEASSFSGKSKEKQRGADLEPAFLLPTP